MDIQGIMDKAALMQEKMLALQARLGDMTVVGQAGEGLVRFTATARKVPVKIEIDERVFDLKDRTVLEQLIMTALDEAGRAADQLLTDKTEELMAELGLQRDFKLPSSA
jgi:nucleoid-associated protein EbfC